MQPCGIVFFPEPRLSTTLSIGIKHLPNRDLELGFTTQQYYRDGTLGGNELF